MGELILLRHGETEWSLAGKHTGRTDIPLTTRGEAAAKALEPVLSRHGIVAVFTSPARPAVVTARRAGLVKVATMRRRDSTGASDLAAASPRGVSGMSVRPVCLPARLHSVSPCLSRISAPMTG